MFGFIADEATDSATKELMALCVRFVDTESDTVQEDFLDFAECESTTGESHANSFLEDLRNLGTQLAFLLSKSSLKSY
ncbi:hypothetical protein DPMN_024164 [Dreissena polymorpha]|uniref:DUF4371 domain-containing protein n=1 Tax=Dreissena polymorpha TaxID=45954 RepID=A0A9D4LP90_DREPO|nr:hypothetical protein DPMN_024164 [Dreissena polymorpha]